MGRLQRHWGFSIDNMLAVELVTADGERIRVSEDEHADLFWGIRGAGPNFGVVSSFEFRLHELGTFVTQGFLAFAADQVREVSARVRDDGPTGPDELMLSFGLGVGTAEDPDLPDELKGRPYVYMAATHSGDPDLADDALKPFRDLAPAVDTIQRRSYLEVLTANDEAMAWGARFYMKGGFLAELSDAFVDAGLASLEDTPGEDCSITLWTQGGAISRVPNDAMAFTGRDAPFWLGVEAEWKDAALDDAHVAWGRATMDALTPFTAAGHYVNDMVEVSEAIARSVYGDEKYERLVGLKRQYDPENVFRRNQNIRP
jgi:FAD/FMN-containing dehydrogenase